MYFHAQVNLKNYPSLFIVAITCVAFFTSCSTLQKSSVHGFHSGYYKMANGKKARKVYADITDENIDVYNARDFMSDKDLLMYIPLKDADSVLMPRLRFSKQSLDIDITSIPLKYRPSANSLPAQLNTDLNMAVYAGWRHDTYKIIRRTDPLGRRYGQITNFGFDFGAFAGLGGTPINSFSTNNRMSQDYTGMIVQTGLAGFVESNVVSFGVAVGIDNLVNRDRKIWVYNNKPWVGFILGIALN